MRILKIYNGFITNSRTDSTTILLAVNKEKDLKKFLQELSLPDDLHPKCLDFSSDYKEIRKITKDMELKLEFLLNEYELFVNTISNDIFRENVGENEDWSEKKKLMWNMIQDIEKESGEDIIVIISGDLHNYSRSFKAPLLYSKEEIFKIFKSDKRNLIKSLIVNRIIEDMKFTEGEIFELKSTLKIPLKTLIYSPDLGDDPEREIHYREYFYKIFGQDYIQALLDLIILKTPGNVYISKRNIEQLLGSYFYSPYIDEEMIRNKIRNWLNKLSFIRDETGELFCESLLVLKKYLGEEELIYYLNDTIYFDILYKARFIRYPNVEIFRKISNAILNLLESKDEDNHIVAKNIHFKMMKLLKSLFSPANFNYKKNLYPGGYAEFTRNNIIRPYWEKKQLDMIIPHLKSVSSKYLYLYLNNQNFKNMKSIILSKLKNEIHSLDDWL